MDNLDWLFIELIESGRIDKLDLYAQLTNRLNGDDLLWEEWNKLDREDKESVLSTNDALEDEAAPEEVRS